MAPNKAIFVDFDECLIHGFHATDGKEPSYDDVKQKFETAWIPDDTEQYVIVIRPGAREFLQELNKITPNVFILTAGMKEFQTRAAKAANLLDLVQGLYGRDSTDVPQFPVSILIDDLWIKSGNTYKKALQMGIIDQDSHDQTLGRSPWNPQTEEDIFNTINKHYIQIPHFLATDPNDDGFQQVLPKVKPKLDEITKEVKELLHEKIITTFTEAKVKEL